MQLIKDLIGNGKISPPSWLADNMLFAIKHGSNLYGTATETSDVDIYGVCMPPSDILFPGETGWVNGFGLPPSFEVWTQHHVGQFDFNIFGLPRFMYLLTRGSPNLIECLFAPPDCVLYETHVSQKLFKHKHLFITKKTIRQYIGYLKSQRHAAKRSFEGKRAETTGKFGYDTKFMSHAVRLSLQCEQLLDYGCLYLRANSDLIKNVRLGKFQFEELETLLAAHLKRLEHKLATSDIPDQVDMKEVQRLLRDLTFYIVT